MGIALNTTSIIVKSLIGNTHRGDEWVILNFKTIFIKYVLTLSQDFAPNKKTNFYG